VSPDEVVRVFGARILRERNARSWSLRELAGKCEDVSINTISRAENGQGTWLRHAADIAGGLGVRLPLLVAESDCAGCDGMPPDGFTCNACGRSS
jgi:transcriptional regulator with XRE-family HTH domain